MPTVSSTPPTTFTAPNRAEGRHPDQAERRRWAKLAEAAEYLGVTEQTIYQMIRDGRLTGYRNGPRLVRVDLNEIDAAMKPYGGAA